MPEVRNGTTVLIEARRLLRRGYAIAPCVGKRAVVAQWPTRRLTEAELDAALTGTNQNRNIAIVLNLSVVIDVECDAPEAETNLLALFGGDIPPTPTWRSKRGLHRLFCRPPNLPAKAKLEIDGIEFRVGNGKGALSIVPPSVHPDGPRYRWLPGLSIHDVAPAKLPAKVVRRLRAPLRTAVGCGFDIPEGQRNDTLFRLACKLFNSGVTAKSVEKALQAENQVRCKPPLPVAEVEAIARSAPNSVIKIIPPAAAASETGDGNTVIKIIPPALDEAAYLGLTGKFLRAVEPYTEATDAGILAHFLPAVGALIGPGPHVYAGDCQPARINTVVVGPTNTGRKGTSFAPVNSMMEKVDPDFWSSQRVSGLSSGEGLITKVADTREKNEDGEWEVTPVEKRLYVIEPEFSRVLANIYREGNILSHVMRESFDSGNLATLTVKPRQAAGAHVCIVAHITPEELVERLNYVELANGFANRFLWFVVKSEKLLPETEPIPAEVFAELKPRLRSLAMLQERCVKLDLGAKARWKKVYPELREDRPGLAGAMTARRSSMVLRLALTYSLLEEKRKIGVEHLEAASAVWRYCEEPAYMLFGGKTGNALADKLLALLRDGPMTKDDFNKHLSEKQKAEVGKALVALQAAKLVRKSMVKHAGAGHPATRWELVG